MINKICSICARGGSKGLPNKNILPLLNKPLIVHTIEHAQKSGIFDAIAVSSDSEEILYVSKKAGVEYLIKRPEEFSSDIAPKIPAIRHCVTEVEKQLNIQFNICVDLDCTSPLRSIQDIIDAVQLLNNNNNSNIFSVTSARRSPYFDMVEQDEEGNIKPCKIGEKDFFRRQDVPLVYDLNASIYVWQRETLMNSDVLYNTHTGIYIMPNERSVEIDSQIDFFYTEMLMSRK